MPTTNINLEDLHKRVDNFKAGQVKHHLPMWESLTNDPVILDAIKHHHIEFEAESPTQRIRPNKIHFSPEEIAIIDAEIAKLVSKEILTLVNYTPDSFISNIFIRPKKDGTHRVILNLKPLNEFVDYHHFKMDTFRTALKLIRPGCFMASADLKVAYYSIPIAEEDRKFLMFEWKGKYHQFTCLPDGLSSAPRIFTKILKPVYAHLRSNGHTCMGHIDDSLLIGQTFHLCQQNIMDTVTLFTKLGFTVHPVKSVLQPQQKIDFLGFVLNSITMMVTLTESKAVKVKSACENLLHQRTTTIRSVAQVIGFLVSSFPAAEFAEMHYRHLELDKICALRESKGNFDAIMTLSPLSRTELTWWVNNVTHASKAISHGNPNLTLTTDASKVGWGAVCGNTSTGGLWSLEEQGNHINYLELKAVLLGLQSLCALINGKHILVQSDNTSTVSYINAMGGIKSIPCNDMATVIWEWCIQRDIWLSATHIPGSENIEADKESRALRDSTEWSLSQEVFNAIQERWGPFDIDLFASRLNFKVPQYVSWRPDPGAHFINPFFMDWKPHYFYAFPPFSVLANCLQKIQQDQSTGLLIAPLWTTQPWFTPLLNLLTDHPLVLPQSDTLLVQPHSNAIHPLSKRLQLIACKVSGNPSTSVLFQAKLPTSSCSLGQLVPKNNMPLISRSGMTFVLNGKLIHTIHL